MLTIQEQNEIMLNNLSWELDDLLEEDRIDEESWNQFLLERKQKLNYQNLALTPSKYLVKLTPLLGEQHEIY